MTLEQKRTGCLLALVILAAIIGICVHGLRAQAAELMATGYQHLAGFDERTILELPDKPEEPEPVSLGVYTITAYCPCERCCGKSPDDPLYGITATGTTATEGRTIAVDPDVIAYGTVVYIDGQAYVAEDCGGGIRGNQIDLFFDSHEDAVQWGVQEREVFVDADS